MDVSRGLRAFRTLAACLLPTISYFCASSAFGARIVPSINPYRMGISRGPVRTHRNDNSEAPTCVRRGPRSATRRKALKASHFWAAGGARAQARMSTVDVLGGLPPEKSRGLHGGPAQRKRTEMGRIRSCCQRWTGLDDCCEELGHVVPGGREGSGNIDNA